MSGSEAGELTDPGRQELAPDLSVEVQRITKMFKPLAEPDRADGSDVLWAVFRARYAIGVKLQNATGDMPGAKTGADWLFTDHNGEGPGWRAPKDWRDVKVAARILGGGGLTLFAAGDREFATLLYNERRGSVWVFEVKPDGQYDVSNLDEYALTHSAPKAIAAIDQCGQVHG